MITSWKRFEAEVLFLNPDDVPRAVEALAAHDLEFKINPDAIDECGPTVFGTVTGPTELSEDDIAHWVCKIIEQFSGDVIEWSYIPNPRTQEAQFIQAYGPEALRDTILFEKPISNKLDDHPFDETAIAPPSNEGGAA